MTLRQVADLAGVSEALITRAELGDRNLGADSLDRIATVLGADRTTRAAWHELRRASKGTRATPSARVDALEARLDDLEARVDRLEQPAAPVMQLRPAAKRRPKEDR